MKTLAVKDSSQKSVEKWASDLRALRQSLSQTKKSFRCEAIICSNPDRDQYFKDMKITIEGLSLKDLQYRQRQFIEESHSYISCEISIGGGNWIDAKVYSPEGNFLGNMTYNGRIFDSKGHEVIS